MMWFILFFSIGKSIIYSSVNGFNFMSCISFALPKQLTVATIQEHYSSLSALVVDDKSTSDIEITVGGLERIDTAGVQVLYAFVTFMASMDRACILKGSSDAFTQAISNTGLTTKFQIFRD